MKTIEKMIQKLPVPEILNLIYPPVCGICGKLNSDFLCKKCERVLETEAIFGIDKYMAMTKIGKNDKNDKKYFNEHLYIFLYQGIIRRIILKYKFQERAYLYKTFVNFLSKNENFFEKMRKYDTIVPVPISKKRFKLRGYNQSVLVAKEISKIINMKIETKCLVKTKNVIEQSKLNKEERIRNVEGVYELANESKLYKKRILLIDDIYTTGSTVNECSRILKKAKPKSIGVFTLAKD